MEKKRKKTEARTLESFIQRKDAGNAVKLASHCDIPGLVSFLVIEDRQIKPRRYFSTGANLYLDKQGFFFDFSEDYGSVQERLIKKISQPIKNQFKDFNIPLISRMVGGQCVTESTTSVSPFEIIEKLNSSDSSKFVDIYKNYVNTHGIYSDRMTKETDTYQELARLLRTEDVLARYISPYNTYPEHFVNSSCHYQLPVSEFMYSVVLPRKSGNTYILQKTFVVVMDLFD